MRRVVLVLLITTVAVTVPALAPGKAPPIRYAAKLAGSNEVPSTDTMATGKATVRVSKDSKGRKIVSFELTAHHLSGPPQAAHVHLGRAGQSGGVLLVLEGRAFGLPARGRLTASDFAPVGPIKTFAQAIAKLGSGELYVNVHTTKFPGGELRGQIRRQR